ncbi:hypothetical protein [Candidatus Nitrosotenuis sp. DW1]|uniref:hypothetical protein n=1 Tax=Candidatus Nitrosotenuis sp. DW1 TaxID=2259672 RepID=UPI0015C78915|nr:hypothetical protein [Candidatus Nitrosotenuis sp. DW1]QLH08793.1 hypothetical protein DSQ19_04225 [Candidatus Nitrosotenuis sp. DW1]
MLEKILIFGICVLVLITTPHAFALDGTSRAELKNVRLVNAFGEASAQNINTNQQVQISADITNMQGQNQDFVYIVQVLDQNKVPVQLTWIKASFKAQQTFSPALSWVTDRPGTYTAQIFLWDSIQNAGALAARSEIKITVS